MAGLMVEPIGVWVGHVSHRLSEPSLLLSRLSACQHQNCPEYSQLVDYEVLSVCIGYELRGVRHEDLESDAPAV